MHFFAEYPTSPPTARTAFARVQISYKNSLALNNKGVLMGSLQPNPKLRLKRKTPKGKIRKARRLMRRHQRNGRLRRRPKRPRAKRPRRRNNFCSLGVVLQIRDIRLVGLMYYSYAHLYLTFQTLCCSSCLPQQVYDLAFIVRDHWISTRPNTSRS